LTLILQKPGGESLTEEQAKFLFMFFLEDDTEDAPWMVMGSLQFKATSDLFHSFEYYAQRHQRPWTVAAMLPIRSSWPGLAEKKQLAPDVFVALAPDHPRPSFDSDAEGGYPPFVLEVVSPASSKRDQVDKLEAYEMLGAKEYALFTPSADSPSTLSGYRRGSTGTFETWQPDDQGRLWSEVLGLYLLVQGRIVRAADREGKLIPTAIEAEYRELAAQEREEAARQEAAAARREAAAAQERAEVVRHEADQEIERLRLEIEQLRRRTEPDFPS
jgi:hypothetical protein